MGARSPCTPPCGHACTRRACSRHSPLLPAACRPLLSCPAERGAPGHMSVSIPRRQVAADGRVPGHCGPGPVCSRARGRVSLSAAHPVAGEWRVCWLERQRGDSSCRLAQLAPPVRRCFQRPAASPLLTRCPRRRAPTAAAPSGTWVPPGCAAPPRRTRAWASTPRPTSTPSPPGSSTPSSEPAGRCHPPIAAGDTA